MVVAVAVGFCFLTNISPHINFQPNRMINTVAERFDHWLILVGQSAWSKITILKRFQKLVKKTVKLEYSNWFNFLKCPKKKLVNLDFQWS